MYIQSFLVQMTLIYISINCNLGNCQEDNFLNRAKDTTKKLNGTPKTIYLRKIKRNTENKMYKTTNSKVKDINHTLLIITLNRNELNILFQKHRLEESF